MPDNEKNFVQRFFVFCATGNMRDYCVGSGGGGNRRVLFGKENGGISGCSDIQPCKSCGGMDI